MGGGAIASICPWKRKPTEMTLCYSHAHKRGAPEELEFMTCPPCARAHVRRERELERVRVHERARVGKPRTTGGRTYAYHQSVLTHKWPELNWTPLERVHAIERAREEATGLRPAY